MKKIINNKKIFFIIIMMISLLSLTACETGEIINQNLKETNRELKVHFLNVGQADSALIQFPNDEVALIDGGDKGKGDFLVDYIKSLNIDKIDYIIATHPHADHIGGLPEVVEAFTIGEVYMPNKTANTRIFERLLEEIKKKDLKITQAKSGMMILDEGDLKFSIIAPMGDEYEGINDYSIVNKLEYKDISLLFTGDIEKQSESELVTLGVDLASDILKVGHHGSNTSSTDEFLDKVSPKYAVISSETGNSYGHPHREVLERLNERNIKVARIDEMGTIILNSDGKTASWNSENGQNSGNKIEVEISKQKKDASEITEKTYIGNKNSKIYHDENCSKLPSPENRITLNSKKHAEEEGYSPHSVCIK